MKDTYVCDLHTRSPGCEVTLLGWIRAKRHQGKVIFLDVCDSTDTIQAVIEEQRVGPIQFNLVKGMPVESAVAIDGLISVQNKRQEVNVRRIYLVGGGTKSVSPNPRGDIDIFGIPRRWRFSSFAIQLCLTRDSGSTRTALPQLTRQC